MRLCYVGNHGSAIGLGAEVGNGAHATTEAHWSAALESLGHEVVRVEEETTPWNERVAVAEQCDMFMWTSTWAFNERWPLAEGFRAIRYLRERRVPTAVVHLDRWRGLSNREWQVRDRRGGSAMFSCDFVFTADGDADDWFRGLGVRHFWLPPGVHEPECVRGTPRPEWASDVASIGGWQDYGHSEHENHRMAMLDALRTWFGDRVAFWPKVGQSGPWGLEYNDLLASVKVVVGDGWQGAERYYSNRCYEAVGRGGFCVHPAVPGLVRDLPEGTGVSYFPPGNWDEMCARIEKWVADDSGRRDAIKRGQRFVRERHTYTSRMAEMLTVMEREGAWR